MLDYLRNVNKVINYSSSLRQYFSPSPYFSLSVSVSVSAVPSEFPSEPKINVQFTADGTPIATLSFNVSGPATSVDVCVSSQESFAVG